MSNESTTRRKLLLGLGTATTAAIAGCGGGGGDPTTAATETTETVMETTETEMDPTETATETEAPNANVRVAHASPNAPNVDVYVAGDRVLQDVAFGEVSDYLPVPAATYEVEITAAGDPDTSVFQGDVAVEAGTDYTVAAIGELGDAADRPFEPLVLVDDNSDPGGDMARVRLVHASPDAPAVDVTLAANGDVLFDGIGYGGSEYVTVPAGQYTIDVRGDTDTNDGDVVTSFDLDLAGGQVYTGFAVGYLTPDDEPADAGFDLVVSPDTGGMGDGQSMGVPDQLDTFLQDANGYDGSIVDATGQDEVTVAVGGGDLAFDPVAVRIDAGTTVTWDWQGGTHNVVSTAESASDFDSGDPTADEDTGFSQSFDDAGQQFYVCEVHEGQGMLGGIDVV